MRGMMLTPETTQSAVMFLISVGALAVNELKERWFLRHKKEEAQIDLSKQGQVEGEAESLVKKLLSEKSDEEVKRVLDLVQRKRKLVYDAQREKLNAEEEYDQGRITLNMLQLRTEKCDQQIKEKLAEVEADLRVLGLNIEKQVA